MTASDLIRIISTVAATQGICDLLAKRFVYTQPRYLNSVSALERARTKRDKALATPASSDQQQQHPQQSQSNNSSKANNTKSQRENCSSWQQDVAVSQIIITYRITYMWAAMAI